MTLASEAKPIQVRFVPGRSVTAELSATVKTGSDEIRTETFVASIGLRVPPTTAIVTTGGTDIAVWRLPADPFLPGLQSVTDPDLASRLLKQLGIDPSGITLENALLSTGTARGCRASNASGSGLRQSSAPRKGRRTPTSPHLTCRAGTDPHQSGLV